MDGVGKLSQMFSSKTTRLLAFVALCATAGAAAYAVSFSADPSGADEGPRLPAPTPTVAGAMPIDEAQTRLAAEFPAAGSVLAAVSARDVDALLGTFQWSQITCLPRSAPQGPTSLFCDAVGVPEGSTIQVFPQEVGFRLERERSSVARLIERFYGAQPRVELIAKRDDGRIALSFATDDWASDVSNSRLVGLVLYLSGTGDTPVELIQTIVSSTTSLDKLRNDELFAGVSQRHNWEIWALSDELAARDEAKHEDRYGSEEARATPSAGK